MMIRIVKNIKTDFGAVGNGADDSAAFTAFNTWAIAQTQPITLILPPAPYTAPSMAAWTSGVKDLVVEGSGASSDLNRIGGGGQFFSLVHSSRIATAKAGDSILTLITSSEHTRYQAEEWILITGLQLQNDSGPTNPAFFEFKKIISKDPVLGTLTLDSPLRETYKATWPFYPNAAIDEGGPATIYALDSSWDASLALHGLRMDVTTVMTMAGAGRCVEMSNCTFVAANPPPSEAVRWSISDCTSLLAGQLEVDKLVETLEFTNYTNPGTVVVQSMCVNNLYFSGCNLGKLIGTSRNTVIRNTTISELDVGPIGYGIAETLLLDNCVIGSVSMSQVGSRISAFSIAKGVLSIPKSVGPIPWAVPGARMYYTDDGSIFNYGTAFTVNDIAESGGNTLIHTDAPDQLPTFSLSGMSPVTKFVCYPCLDVTAVGCTGSGAAIDLSGALPHRPLFEHVLRTLGPITVNPMMRAWGTLVSYRVNVTKPYTGIHASLKMNIGSGMDVLNGSYTYFQWNPVVDLRTLGERIVQPSSVTGAQAGDLLSAPGPIWLIQGIMPNLTADITGEDSSVWPVYTVELFTSQG